MKKLEIEQLEKLQGGDGVNGFKCAVAVVGAGLFVASLFFPPTSATAVVAFYTLGPTVAGIGVADACSTLAK
jgi:hypothetical protein